MGSEPAMLESTLHGLIPKEVNTFPKLQRGTPYHFDSWKNDRNGTPCLYYWFVGRNGVKRNKKRVPVSEIRDALLQIRSARVLNRETFPHVCPRANSDGPCGFAVVGRILEILHVAVYSDQDGFKLTDADVATNLLKAQPTSSVAPT